MKKNSRVAQKIVSTLFYYFQTTFPATDRAGMSFFTPFGLCTDNKSSIYYTLCVKEHIKTEKGSILTGGTRMEEILSIHEFQNHFALRRLARCRNLHHSWGPEQSSILTRSQIPKGSSTSASSKRYYFLERIASVLICRFPSLVARPFLLFRKWWKKKFSVHRLVDNINSKLRGRKLPSHSLVFPSVGFVTHSLSLSTGISEQKRLTGVKNLLIKRSGTELSPDVYFRPGNGFGVSGGSVPNFRRCD